MCNLYIISAKNIKKILSNEDFVLPFQTRESRKINQTYYSKVLAFKKDSAVMFDIVCETCQRINSKNYRRVYYNLVRYITTWLVFPLTASSPNRSGYTTSEVILVSCDPNVSSTLFHLCILYPACRQFVNACMHAITCLLMYIHVYVYIVCVMYNKSNQIKSYTIEFV